MIQARGLICGAALGALLLAVVILVSHPAGSQTATAPAPTPCENTRDQYAVIVARLQTRELELQKALEDAAKKLAAAEAAAQPAAKPAEKK